MRGGPYGGVSDHQDDLWRTYTYRQVPPIMVRVPLHGGDTVCVEVRHAHLMHRCGSDAATAARAAGYDVHSFWSPDVLHPDDSEGVGAEIRVDQNEFIETTREVHDTPVMLRRMSWLESVAKIVTRVG